MLNKTYALKCIIIKSISSRFELFRSSEGDCKEQCVSVYGTWLIWLNRGGTLNSAKVRVINLRSYFEMSPTSILKQFLSSLIWVIILGPRRRPLKMKLIWTWQISYTNFLQSEFLCLVRKMVISRIPVLWPEMHLLF